MSKQNLPPMKGKPKMNFSALGRVLKMLFSFYPVLMPLTCICILLSAGVSAMPALFQQRIFAIIDEFVKSGNVSWEAAKERILPLSITLASLYVIAIILITLYTQLMAYITQGFLNKMRHQMFERMQKLPISYFDTHKHGDIMSYYTNDIDTLRQLVSQSLPTFIQAGTIVITVFFIMMWYSIWMTLIISLGVFAMIMVSKKVGGGSAKFFMRQQKSIAEAEGFVQEMMNGQRVIKVFTHEQKCQEDFDKINEQLCQDSYRAHSYANMLGPIIMNIGNVLYVICVMAGGLFVLTGCPNISISGLPFTIDIVVPFLGMTKQFTGNVNSLSQQINSIVMSLAGAQRIFTLMDEMPEADEGYVTLVNADMGDNGEPVEVETDRAILTIRITGIRSHA